MSSYDCYDQQGEYRVGAFPDDAIGLDEWRRLLEQLGRLQERGPDQSDQDPLSALRALHQRRNQLLRLRCPRVFVSHRQCDKDEALRVAWLANAEKFDYWLDILDPKIAAASLKRHLTAYQQAILLAAIIEMALLNCTHVVAVMTKNVPGTMWMPYEYGRVKDSALTSLRIAAWFDQSWQLSNIAEYFHLGQKLYSDAAVRYWLKTQFTHWKTKGFACPSMLWPLQQEPAPLQNSSSIYGDGN
jgi:hypothetical protein